MSSTHQLSNDVVVALVLHQFEDSSDVGVLQIFEHLEFVFVELLIDLMLAKLLLLDDLDSAGHFRATMDASFDCAKRSSTELPVDLVVRCKAVSRLEFHLLLERQEVFLDLLLL